MKLEPVAVRVGGWGREAVWYVVGLGRKTQFSLLVNRGNGEASAETAVWVWLQLLPWGMVAESRLGIC